MAINLKFRRRTKVIEAFQMTEEHRTNQAGWPTWMRRAWKLDRGAPGSLHPADVPAGVWDGALELREWGWKSLVELGDWIVREAEGDLTVYDEDDFKALYEEVIE